MPENIRKALPAALLLLGLTGSFIYPHAAAAASIANLTGAPQTIGISAGGGASRQVTIDNGKTVNITGDVVVRYHDFNIQMGGDQQLSLLKNGGFRLQTGNVGGGDNNNGNGNDNNNDNDDSNSSGEGISI